MNFKKKSSTFIQWRPRKLKKSKFFENRKISRFFSGNFFDHFFSANQKYVSGIDVATPRIACGWQGKASGGRVPAWEKSRVSEQIHGYPRTYSLHRLCSMSHSHRNVRDRPGTFWEASRWILYFLEKIHYCPRRGYCVEGSKKSCSSVRACVRGRAVTKSVPGPLFGTFVKARWSLGVPKLTPSGPGGKMSAFRWFLNYPRWRMSITSGLLYAIVPSGATLALRVLSS